MKARESAVVAMAMLCGTLGAAAARGVEPGGASGTLTVNGSRTRLAHAVMAKTENLFDEKKKDTLVVVSDRPLADVAADDEVSMQLRAREGGLVALVLRLDGPKLVNVAVHAQGLDGMVVLPGAWFTYKGSAPGAGSLRLAERGFEERTYACSVEFAAVPAGTPKAAAQEAVAAEPVPEPTPTLPPATTNDIPPGEMTALLVAAMMSKDEDHALQLVKLGADPNARDQYGTPVLNWAVMMCMPRLVKALVDRGADLTYQRAPGMTILTEAGACPEAAKILRAAGAK